MLDRQAFLANTGLQRVDQVSALPEVPPPCKSPPGWTPARAGNSIAEGAMPNRVAAERQAFWRRPPPKCLLKTIDRDLCDAQGTNERGCAGAGNRTLVVSLEIGRAGRREEVWEYV